MLEVEGPTSADAGVASCLLFNAEPVFRRLRDDLFLVVGMIRLGGFELRGAFTAQTVNWNFAIEKRRATLSSRATLKRQGFRMVTVGSKTKLEN